MLNKSGEKCACLLTESNLHNKGVQENDTLSKSGSKKRKERKISKAQAYKRTQLEKNRGYIKSLSRQNITDHEINVLSKGLKFIPTPLTKEQHIRRQLLQDFEQFVKRMRLKCIFHGQNNKQDSTLTAARLPGAIKNFIGATKFQILVARSGN